MSLKGQRPDRHAKGFDFLGAAEFRQLDHEISRQHEDWGCTASWSHFVAAPAGLTSQAASPNFGRKT